MRNELGSSVNIVVHDLGEIISASGGFLPITHGLGPHFGTLPTHCVEATAGSTFTSTVNGPRSPAGPPQHRNQHKAQRIPKLGCASREPRTSGIWSKTSFSPRRANQVLVIDAGTVASLTNRRRYALLSMLPVHCGRIPRVFEYPPSARNHTVRG